MYIKKYTVFHSSYKMNYNKKIQIFKIHLLKSYDDQTYYDTYAYCKKSSY